MRNLKVVSGGQTGVDRAALDVAIDMQIEHGGWCPANRLAEDGAVPLHYNLVEHESSLYSDRTKQNIIDSDGTLVLYRIRLQGGTALTVRLARQLQKPLLLIRLDRNPKPELVQDWIERESIRILNVAGPRGSSSPSIYQSASQFLRDVFNGAIFR